jgi:hypothetical protein
MHLEINYEEMLAYHCPRWDELPDIALYMDQVLSVIEKHIGLFSRNEGESVTTSTMINNYVKQNVVLPPIKKKYQKEQLAQLLVIGIAKRVLSISEIDDLIRLLMKKYTMKHAYDLFCESFETALKITFGENNYTPRYNGGADNPDATDIALNAAVFAVADKLLVTEILSFSRKEEETVKALKKKPLPEEKEKPDKSKKADIPDKPE